VASQLSVLHRSGDFHRNVRPENIYLDVTGRACLISGDNDPASSGCADYLAPEQALNADRVDERSDIYSLGCTMYFLLTGQPPFPDGTVSERLRQHQIATPVPIASVRPDVPQELAAICERMLAKQPKERYQTAAEVVEATQQWLGTVG
jgi:serine/threonine protein kinase